MTKVSDPDSVFSLRPGSGVRPGWLGADVQFLTRSLRFLLRPQGAALRAAFHLEAGDIGVMAMVGANPGLSQNDLAASLVLKKSAVTRVVQRLESRGFLTRSPSPRDRRAKSLILTPEGSLLAEAVRTATQAQQANWFEGIDPGSQAVFFDVMRSLLARLVTSGLPMPEDDDGGP